MKRKAIMWIALSVALIAVVPIQAAERELPISELLGASVESKKVLWDNGQRRIRAIGDKEVTQRMLADIISELSRESASEARTKKAEQAVKQYIKRVAGYESQRTQPYIIANAKTELAMGKRLVAATQLTDPAQRQSELEKAKNEKKAVDAEIAEIVKPFDDFKQNIEAQMLSLHAQFPNAMKRYAKTPRGPFAGTLAEVSPPQLMYVSIYTWNDAEGNRLAQAKLQIQKPRRKPIGMLDDKYPITRMKDGRLHIHAGEFMIYFESRHDELSNKDVLLEQVKNFVDLVGLAKIKIATEPKLPMVNNAP